jgi:CBS domain-containing protein
MMRVKDIMTKSVVNISSQATVAEAISLMVSSRVSGLPVVDEVGTLVGVLSEGDLLRRIELGTQKTAHWLNWLFRPGQLSDAYKHTHGRKVEEIMSGDVCTIDQNLPLEAAVGLMDRRHIKRLPVMEGLKVVGIITRADFVRALAALVSRASEEVAISDAEIRDRILSELKKESWAPRGTVDPQVANGVVQLQGTIFNERERDAIRVMAENVYGVQAVHDHLIWIDPMGMTVLQSPEDAARAREEIKQLA